MNAETDASMPPEHIAAALTVPLSVELEAADVPLARLQALREGVVLDLADSGGRLGVRILAGKQLLATGVLVSVGDGYGVLIETLARAEV